MVEIPQETDSGKTNVLILTSSFPQISGSPDGNFIFELISNLPGKNIIPFVLTPHFPEAPLKEYWPPVQLFRFPYFFPSRYEHLAYGSGIIYNLRKNPFLIICIPPFLISEFMFSWYMIKKFNISLVHTHWFLPQGFIGSLFYRFLKIPHVATVHGSDLNLIKNHPVLHPICRFIVRNSDIVTVNSSFMERQLTDIVPGSVGKIRVIPMGIDPEKFSTVSVHEKNKRVCPGKIILSVGRLIDWKGTIYLIEAMPQVLEKYPDSHLVIIGTGPEESDLKQRAKELKLEQNVRFMGFVSNEELPSYYHMADVFVLPSIDLDGNTEGLGVVLLEAMASGCPVIGSNVGGIPDIIIDCKNGFLVPAQEPALLAEKIVILLSDMNLAEGFRKNGCETVRSRFSWRQISHQFSDVYEQGYVGHHAQERKS